MNWIVFLLFALILWFVVSRMLPVKGLRNLSEAEAHTLLQTPDEYEFLDVREVHEYERGHIPGFRNIPLSQLPSRMEEIDRSRTVVLTCQSGMRSLQAARVLHKRGIRSLCHLRAGVGGWSGKLVR